MSAHKTSSSTVFILIASGFDEKLVVNVLCKFREAGLAVSLVGLVPGITSSFLGLAVRCDLSIDQIPQKTVPLLVFIPGNSQCASSLMADPRVHLLLERTLASKGIVAASTDTQSVLGKVGFSKTISVNEFLNQEALETQEFINQMVNVLGN